MFHIYIYIYIYGTWMKWIDVKHIWSSWDGIGFLWFFFWFFIFSDLLTVTLLANFTTLWCDFDKLGKNLYDWKWQTFPWHNITMLWRLILLHQEILLNPRNLLLPVFTIVKMCDECSCNFVTQTPDNIQQQFEPVHNKSKMNQVCKKMTLVLKQWGDSMTHNISSLFVVFCLFCAAFLVNSCDLFAHIHQICFTGTGVIPGVPFTNMD